MVWKSDKVALYLRPSFKIPSNLCQNVPQIAHLSSVYAFSTGLTITEKKNDAMVLDKEKIMLFYFNLIFIFHVKDIFLTKIFNIFYKTLSIVAVVFSI